MKNKTFTKEFIEEYLFLSSLSLHDKTWHDFMSSQEAKELTYFIYAMDKGDFEGQEPTANEIYEAL